MAAVLLQLSFFTAFLLLCRPATAAPSTTPELLSPYLDLGGSDGRKEVSRLLRELDCDTNNIFDFLYTQSGPGILLSRQASRTRELVDLYNGNVELLQLIYAMGWVEDMCSEKILSALSSVQFCSEVEFEEKLEDVFISQMKKSLAALKFVNVINFAADLQKMKKKEDCIELCGGSFVSVLCTAFTKMSTFIMEVIEMDTINSQPDEPLTHDAEPVSTHTQPNVDSDHEDRGKVRAGVMPSNLTNATSKTVSAPLGSADVPNSSGERVEQPSAPNIPTSDKGEAPSVSNKDEASSMSDEALQKALLKFIENKLHLDNAHLLQLLQSNQNAQPPANPAPNDAGAPTVANVTPLSPKTQESMPVGEDSDAQPAEVQSNPVSLGEVGDNEGGFDLPGEADQQQTDKPEVQDGTVEVPEQGNEDLLAMMVPVNRFDKFSDLEEENGENGYDKSQENYDGNEYYAGANITTDPARNEGEMNQPLVNDRKVNGNPEPEPKLSDEEGKKSDGGVQQTTAEVENKQQVLADEDEEEEEGSGGGYRSIHFFSILLVLAIVTIAAYLFVHHKKKIKGTMKDYMGDTQKRRRTRGYKPLLSGNK